MKTISVREMVLAGLFVAIGVVLPAMFHFVGLGSTFLPMHIPVLIAAFILGFPYALAVGMITPFLSSLITGMPPAFPVMPYMVFELGAYAAVASFLSRKMKLNVYGSLLGSMVAGRLVAGVAVWVLVMFFGAKFPSPFVFIISAITTGLPGIIVQLVLIPPVIMLCKRVNIIRSEGCSIEQ